METKPMASNASVAAELRKLQAEWRKRAINSREESGRIRRTIMESTDTTADYWRSCFESGMSPEQAELWDNCADELEPFIAQLEAPSMTPTTADEIMAKRIKEECWDPDCETFDLAHCQALVGLHRMAPDPALEELRQAARDEALREPANEKLRKRIEQEVYDCDEPMTHKDIMKCVSNAILSTNEALESMANDLIIEIKKNFPSPHSVKAVAIIRQELCNALAQLSQPSGKPAPKLTAVDNTISITIRGQEQVAIVTEALHKAGFVHAQAEAGQP